MADGTKRLSPGGAGFIVAVLAVIAGWVIGSQVPESGEGFAWLLGVPFFAAAVIALALGFVADALLDGLRSRDD